MFRQPRVHAWLAGVEGVQPLNVGIERLRVKHRSASDDVARAARGATKRRAWTGWVIQGFEETVEERGGHASLRFVLAQDLFCPIFASSPAPALDEEQASIPLSLGAHQILDAAEGISDSGLAGAAIWVQTSSVSVYWHGVVPAQVQRAIDEVSKTVRVDVVPAEYSLAQLEVATKEIQPEVDPSNGKDDYVIQDVRMGYDGSGLDVYARKFTDEKWAELQRNPYVRSVSVRAKSEEPVPLTRQNDSPPWYAGGRIKLRGAGSADDCSTGLSLLGAGGSINYILTANHCYTNGTVVHDGAGDSLGTVTHVYPSLDAELIAVTGSSMGRMLDGAWNESPTSEEPVRRWSANAQYDFVCASGSVSGTRCNLKIMLINDKPMVNVHTVIGHWADENSGGIASAKGDSGGPVISNLPSPVTARGTISTGAGLRGCTGSVDPTQMTCFNSVFFSPISTILSLSTASLMTATN